MPIAIEEDWTEVIAARLAQRPFELPDVTITMSVSGTASGDLQASWNAKDGKLSSAQLTDAAEVTLTTDAKAMAAILAGTELPVAFMRGQLKASGDAAKAMALFKAAAPNA